MMSDHMTLGDIARQLGEKRTRVQYAVEKAGIPERGRAGILRLYSADQLPVIQAALETVRPHKRREPEAVELAR